MSAVVPNAIRRIRRSEAVLTRATRRVVNRQMLQAYPPQRGSGKRPPMKMQGQLRWRLSGGIFGGMDSSVRWGLFDSRNILCQPQGFSLRIVRSSSSFRPHNDPRAKAPRLPDSSSQWQCSREQSLAVPAIRRIGRPAAVARRAARRVATRQMPQAYPPRRGIGKPARRTCPR
jgi:hypothetical protein